MSSTLARSLGSRRARVAPAAVALALLVAACGGSTPSAAPSTAATPAASTAATPTTAASAAGSPAASAAAATPAGAPVKLTVGLGYLQSVQFAPFYLAQQRADYEAAGLEVTLENDIDPDLITKLGAGAVDIGSGDGTSVIPAVSQGIPVVYAATIYGTFPAVVIARGDAGIKTAADLRGKRIGTPGRYGTNWIMLLALLDSAGLTTDDVTIVEFPDYGQVAALQQGQVDAVTGFANNEPVQLANAGLAPVTLAIDDLVPLPGPGLVTGTKTLAAKGDALKAFTAVTLRAMADITADPQVGVDATLAAVPTLASDPALQRQILDATVATWKNARTGGDLGSIDRAGWQASIDEMTKLGLVPNAVTVDQLVTDALLP